MKINNSILVKNKYRIIQFGVYPKDINIIKGGVESSVYGLTNSLVTRTENLVKVITYPDKSYSHIQRYFFASNLEVVFLPNRFKYEILSILSIISIIREISIFKPSICHLHGTTFLVLLVSLYLRILGKKFIITVHGISKIEYEKSFLRSGKFIFKFKNWIYGFVELLVINIANNITVGTEYVREWVLANRIRKIIHLTIIPQGVDDCYYHPGSKFEKNLLLSIGSISERKGYEKSIISIKLVTEIVPRIQYYIIGFKSNSIYKEKLTKLIHDLELTDTVFIITNATKNELISYLQKSDIFILHTHEESQGIVFCEAMAAGKPIVSTNVGGIPYVIEHGINGLLSDYDDKDSFSRNIINLLQNETLRMEIVENNLKKSTLYKWDTVTSSVLSFYHSIEN